MGETAEPGDDSVSIGATIRARRQQLELTLVEVARRSGLSHPFLSQVERGRARLSLASLTRVCRALGTSEVELMSGTLPKRASVTPAPHVLRAGQALRGAYGLGEGYALADANAAFMPIDLRSDNADAGEYYLHAEAEFVLVVAGGIQLDLGDHGSVRMDEGDSVYLVGGTPHRWFNPDGNPYRLFLVKERLDEQRPGSRKGRR